MNRRDIRGRVGEAGEYARSHGVTATNNLATRLPGQVPHGAGWHNLYARPGNAARNMDLAKTNTFHPSNVERGVTNDLFAGHNGEVFRRGNTSWEQRGGELGHQQQWSGYNRTPEAQFQRPSFGSNIGGYGQLGGGLDRDAGARNRGFSRASAFHGAGGGFHTFSGGGFHGGGGGGFHGGGGGHR